MDGMNGMHRNHAMNGMNGMSGSNGFAQHGGLHEADFEEPKGLSVKTFDAFPKTKPSYLTRTRSGNTWTILVLVASAWLVLAETRRWFAGTISHAFTVEKGVSHALQINVDVVVAMHCDDINVNVQDAAGDRILAGVALKLDKTNWRQWGGRRGDREHALHQVADEAEVFGDSDEDVHETLSQARRDGRRFKRTPRIRGEADSCRIYGSLEGNKVQGDFHITARGHGYIEMFAEHLDHKRFNFSHHINELSFGPYYPSLVNPLDNTVASTERNFHKFQYYCNVVPTIYTTDVHHLTLTPRSGSAEPLTNIDPNSRGFHGSTVWTNQYAVNEHSRAIPENTVPGVFFKYDIEPILLVVNEQRGGFLALLVRLVNVVSGILVTGTWLLQFSDWVLDNWGGLSGRRDHGGFLGTRLENKFV